MGIFDPAYFSGPGVPGRASDAPSIPDPPSAFGDPAKLGPAGKAIGQADYPMGPIVALPSQLGPANAWGVPGAQSTNTPPPTSIVGQGAHKPFTGKE